MAVDGRRKDVNFSAITSFSRGRVRRAARPVRRTAARCLVCGYPEPSSRHSRYNLFVQYATCRFGEPDEADAGYFYLSGPTVRFAAQMSKSSCR